MFVFNLNHVRHNKHNKVLIWNIFNDFFSSFRRSVSFLSTFLSLAPYVYCKLALAPLKYRKCKERAGKDDDTNRKREVRGQKGRKFWKQYRNRVRHNEVNTHAYHIFFIPENLVRNDILFWLSLAEV